MTSSMSRAYPALRPDGLRGFDELELAELLPGDRRTSDAVVLG